MASNRLLQVAINEKGAMNKTLSKINAWFKSLVKKQWKINTDNYFILIQCTGIHLNSSEFCIICFLTLQLRTNSQKVGLRERKRFSKLWWFSVVILYVTDTLLKIQTHAEARLTTCCGLLWAASTSKAKPVPCNSTWHASHDICKIIKGKFKWYEIDIWISMWVFQQLSGLISEIAC